MRPVKAIGELGVTDVEQRFPHWVYSVWDETLHPKYLTLGYLPRVLGALKERTLTSMASVVCRFNSISTKAFKLGSLRGLASS